MSTFYTFFLFSLLFYYAHFFHDTNGGLAARHGVILTKGSHRAVFLPEVPIEHGLHPSALLFSSHMLTSPLLTAHLCGF